ncbi:hypothetical protein ACWC2T_34440 [Streptomyces sp. NPDC001393]
MAPGAFTHSIGMRLAIVPTAHLQARDLDHGLELCNRSVDVLRPRPVQPGQGLRGQHGSHPWRHELAVREFIRRTRKEPCVAA